MEGERAGGREREKKEQKENSTRYVIIKWSQPDVVCLLLWPCRIDENESQEKVRYTVCHNGYLE